MHLEALNPNGSQIVVAADSYLVLTDDADKVLMSTIAYNDAYRMRSISDKQTVQTKIQLLSKAIDFEPDNFVAHAALAELLYRREQFDEAYLSSKKAVELMPHDKQYLRTHLDILLKLP